MCKVSNPNFPLQNKVYGPLEGACGQQVCWVGRWKFFWMICFKSVSKWTLWKGQNLAAVGFSASPPWGKHLSAASHQHGYSWVCSSKARLWGWEQQELFHLMFCTKPLAEKLWNSNHRIAGFLFYSNLEATLANHLQIVSFRLSNGPPVS